MAVLRVAPLVDSSAGTKVEKTVVQLAVSLAVHWADRMAEQMAALLGALMVVQKVGTSVV